MQDVKHIFKKNYFSNLPGGAGLGLQNTANNPAWLGSIHVSCQISELMFINCPNLTLIQKTRQQCYSGVCNLIILLRCLLGRVQTARPGGGPACFPFASGAEQAQSCVRLKQLLFFLCATISRQILLLSETSFHRCSVS